MTTVETTGTHYLCRRSGLVSGAKPMTHPYSNVGRYWTPHRIDVTYQFIEGWEPETVKLVGAFNKKDGTVGGQATDVRYMGTLGLPDWAYTWVKENTPTMREPDVPATTAPLHIDIDTAVCQDCGWCGLETEVERSTGPTPTCGECGGTDICYFIQPSDAS